jgi:hypothetical protein
VRRSELDHFIGKIVRSDDGERETVGEQAGLRRLDEITVSHNFLVKNQHNTEFG